MGITDHKRLGGTRRQLPRGLESQILNTATRISTFATQSSIFETMISKLESKIHNCICLGDDLRHVARNVMCLPDDLKSQASNASYSASNANQLEKR